MCYCTGHKDKARDKDRAEVWVYGADANDRDYDDEYKSCLKEHENRIWNY